MEWDRLNAKGQCPHCHIKPIKYKRVGGPHFFCHRCSRGFDIETQAQIENWAWKLDGDRFVTTRKHV